MTRPPAGAVAITPAEAAAVDRLLDAYISTEDGDPGMADLRTLLVKIRQIDQDHAAYYT